MSAKANYFKIGLFVLTAAAIAIAAITVLGAGRLLQKRVLVETYINESAQGLDIGSAVRYRGVQIGNVTDLDFVHKQYNIDPASGIRYVLIRIKLDPDAFTPMAGKDVEAALENEIDHGLRVRMSAQGLTGAYYLEVDYMDPERNPPLPIAWKPLHYHIPSATSTISRMSESIEAILRKLEATKIEVVAQDLHDLLMALKTEVEDARLADIHTEITTLFRDMGKEVRQAQLGKLHDEASAVLKGLEESNRSLRAVFSDPEIARILSETSGAVSGARRLFEENTSKVAEILDTLKSASVKLDRTSEDLGALARSGNLSGALEHLQAVLRKIDLIVSRQQGSIDAIFENVARSSKDLQELLREARKHPSGFLFGEPPPPRSRGERP